MHAKERRQAALLREAANVDSICVTFDVLTGEQNCDCKMASSALETLLALKEMKPHRQELLDEVVGELELQRKLTAEFKHRTTALRLQVVQLHNQNEMLKKLNYTFSERMKQYNIALRVAKQERSEMVAQLKEQHGRNVQLKQWTMEALTLKADELAE